MSSQREFNEYITEKTLWKAQLISRVNFRISTMLFRISLGDDSQRLNKFV